MPRNRNKRHMAQVTVPCDEHGPHTVVLSSEDDFSSLLARFIAKELPFLGIEVKEWTITIYAPHEDEMPF